ncbi:MAG: type III-A CRISPR-associated protein Csm2 [Chloroflexota bacterium]|nr:type III-A CRISPR-associated protein Csm2 [Chloroflexota bacterium]
MAKRISDQDISKIIAQGDAVILVREADRFGSELANDRLSKSQIRGAFGTVRQIQANWEKDEPQTRMRKVLLLKPRLAYQGARDRKVKPLANVLSTAIDEVSKASAIDEQTQRFERFVDLFEAILAYHTAAGGK